MAYPLKGYTLGWLFPSAATLLLGCIAIHMVSAAISTPRLEVPEATVILRQVDDSNNQNFVCSISIQNSGYMDVTIRSFRTSCGCTSVEPDAMTIARGQTAIVSLTLSLLADGIDSETVAVDESFSVYLAAFIQEPNGSRYVWKIAGHKLKRSASIIRVAP